ncbi:MAG: hypothetical protein MUP13_01885, partial [Thermoanaerobaculales bacterium]|nr:hypothetical protein [Thermoanaerobaculales bacterium]
GGLGAIPSREGQLPAPNSGQEDLGRSYGEFGKGTLEIEPSFGDKIIGRFNFNAVDTGADKSVNVEGQFIAIPRPLTEDNLWNGCELMQVPEEDNGDIELAPAVYPPGFESEEDDEEDICADFPSWIVCVCTLSAVLYPELCFGDDPEDCEFGEPVETVIDDWHEAINEQGERVLRQRVRRSWPVIKPPRNGGKRCPPPEEFNRDRPIGDDSADCKYGDPVDTLIEECHEVIGADGEPVGRRVVRREWPVIEPARNGGRKCPDPELIPEECPIEEECVDCVVGGMTTEVEVDWHVVVIGGKRFWKRIVRTDWEILQEPNSCGKPCPEGGNRIELRPISESEDDDGGSPFDPGTGGDEGDPPPPPGGGKPPEPPGDESEELGPKLILDFLEEGQANLRSAPQAVKGSASIGLVSVAGKPFKLGMSLTDAEIASCRFNQSVRMGLKMLGSGRTIKGSLNLNAAAGDLELELKFDQGTIGVTGAVSLSVINATTIRGVVAGGTLNLALDQGNFSCKNLMDFSFTLTEVP